MTANLLVVGSAALDDLEGPFGHVSEEPGGSAIYFALAASLVMPVRLHCPVGVADADRFRRLFEGRDVDLGGLVEVAAPTYRWSARQAAGVTTDLGSRDSIYDAWAPTPPAGYAGWAFVGSMRPDRQLEAARRLGSSGLLAGDAMLSYLVQLPQQVAEMLRLCHWYFATGDELRSLGGDPDQPEHFRADRGLQGLAVKRGSAGVSLYTATGEVRAPASTRRPVVDATGAGDALAGGFLARWLALGGGADALPAALACGIECASIAISDIGVRGLVKASPGDVS